jgi:hypothetical protein
MAEKDLEPCEWLKQTHLGLEAGIFDIQLHISQNMKKCDVIEESRIWLAYIF